MDRQSSARLWLPVADDTQQNTITTAPDSWAADEWEAYIEEYRELLNET